MKPFQHPYNITLSSTDVFALQSPSSAVAIRLLYAEGCANEPYELVFQSDDTGLAFNATRITVYHFRDTKVTVTCHSKTVFVILVGQSTNETQFTQIIDTAKNATLTENTFSENLWEVGVDVGGSLFSIQRNVSLVDQAGSIISRKVNNKEITTGVYLVNGEDMATKILG
jgi:hypothetical protein